MSLAEFRALAPGHKGGKPCWHTTLDLSEEDMASLDEALAAPEISERTIAMWLVLHDAHISRTSVGTHRRRECRCLQP